MFRQIYLAGFATILLSGFSAQSANAEALEYKFEKPHTQITFFADHLGFSHSLGRFLDFDGSIMFDQEHPEKSSVDVVIKTDSLEMNMEKWNDHLKNADFFDVEKYPEMHFKSTAIKLTGEKTADITGDLTMLGETHHVVLQTVFNKAGKHPMKGSEWAGFSATATLDRTEWGMDYGVPMMSPEVEIRIEVEAGVMSDDEAAAK